MISIIIPVYNAEKYLAKCINSIISQSNKDWELILIDDGSTDLSSKICREYCQTDHRIKYYYTNNGGPSRARNYGLEKATGEWILFIDSDDWIDHNLLDLPLTRPNSDLIFFGIQRRYLDRTERCSIDFDVLISDHSSIIDDILYKLFTNKDQLFGYTCNKFFKRSIINNNNIYFIESLRIKEDEVFTLTYCNYINSISVTNKALYNYRILSNSLSHNKNNYCNYFSLCKTLEKIINNNHYSKLHNAFIQRIMNYYLFSLIEMTQHKHYALLLQGIKQSDRFYQQNRQQITIQNWISILYKIKFRPIRYITIYIYMIIRSVFK